MSDNENVAGRRATGRRALLGAGALLAAPAIVGTARADAATAAAPKPVPQPGPALSATVDELRALTHPVPNVVYYVVDAAEPGPFVYEPSDTTSADDGATVLVSAARRFAGRPEPRYVRLGTNGVYSVQWFGAVGDGTTDDTAAFTAALAAAGITTLVVPAGTYLLSEWVIVPSAVTVDYQAGAQIPGYRLIDARRQSFLFDGVPYFPGRVDPSIGPASPDGSVGTVILSEDFSSGAIPATWTVTAGNWSVANGALTGTGSTAAIWLGTGTPANFRWEADYTLTDSDTTRWINLRYAFDPVTNTGPGINLRIGTTVSGGVEIYRYDNGTVSGQVELSSAVSLGSGNTHHITFQVLLDVLSVAIDGTVVMTEAAPRIYEATDQGQFGYVTSGLTAVISNVTITDLGGEPFLGSEEFYLDPIFNLTRPASGAGIEGLTFANGYYYGAFDLGYGPASGDYSQVVKYALDGSTVQTSNVVQLGHVAELAYRQANDRLYVVTGGGTYATYINEFDLDTSTIVSTLNFATQGNSGLVAIDNDRDLLVVYGAANDNAPFTIALADFDGNILHQFSHANLDVPQGMDTRHGVIYLSTNNAQFQAHINVLDFNGTLLARIPMYKSGRETQGMTLSGDYATPSLTVTFSPGSGYASSATLYALRSVENQAAYHSPQLLGSGASAHSAPSIPLVPKLLALGLSNSGGAGDWATVTTPEAFPYGSVVETITTSATALTVALTRAFSSTGFTVASPGPEMVAAGIAVAMSVTGNTVTFQFYNGTTLLDPQTIPAGYTFTALALGGLSIWE